MTLLALPNEVLLDIARYLLQSPTSDCDCDCHNHHISQHLSAFSRSNRQLHALLAEYLLSTASTLHMLLWAVANSRTDTVALALHHGADPNIARGTDSHSSPSSRIRSAVNLAISMRDHSVNAELHALKLDTLALLLGAGGIITADILIAPARCGDLDLLTLCLPHFTVITERYVESNLRTLLDVASWRGHVEVAKLVINAGAIVNSVGEHDDTGFYPPLWEFCETRIEILQVFLDAGADPTWRAPDGISVVRNMCETLVGMPGLEDKIALLVRYGAVDDGAGRRKVWWRAKLPPPRPATEYRGWVPDCDDMRQRYVGPFDWVRGWRQQGREKGCRCG